MFNTMTQAGLALACILIYVTPVAVGLDDDGERRAKLNAMADYEETVMVPMRDGVRLATDIYKPKNTDGKVPTVFWRTPYNFHQLKGSLLRFTLSFVERGYAFVIQNERGKYHSEGEWEILGRPRTDGYDALSWIAAQPWSNGRVGTLGCSSSAEWQLALAATNHPAHAAMVPMGAGAGIGRVADFYEQGNWYRGGTLQILFVTWLYSVQNTQRPQFAEGTSDEDLVRLSKYYDLAPDMPDVNWKKKIRHLPFVDIMREVGGPKGIFAAFHARKPDDPAWYKGGLYHDDEDFGVPALWLNSWYDISIGPNMAMYNHVRANASDPDVRNNQYAIIAPTKHCRFFEPDYELVVGERSMGDASFDYEGTIARFFDRWLKPEMNGFEKDTPRVQYYAMGANQWRSAGEWPPKSGRVVTLYLDSDGEANSLFGNGRLRFDRPVATTGDGQSSRVDVTSSGPTSTARSVDRFVYDPTVPVPSLGGGVCCIAGLVDAGAFDQRSIEARADVLVYTSEPLEKDLNVTGTVRVTLYVSSDAKDTEFTVKRLDVYPDGRAYNIDDSLQRVRYREGYDKEVFMEKGEIYELAISPMTTSNVFLKGHRIRLEVSSSNFPRFARNLNTGGPNYNESEPVTARNAVHHSAVHPSRVELSVVE